MTMRWLLAPLLAFVALPAAAQVTATLPVTCNAAGTLCTVATPVTNPDGTALGSPVASASATNALTATTSAGSATLNAKATGGNAYSVNVSNGTTAGCLVLYDSATTPTSGTALTASAIRFHLFLAASTSFFTPFQMPIAFANGVQVLFSTTCTTYTTPATTPVVMSVQVK